MRLQTELTIRDEVCCVVFGILDATLLQHLKQVYASTHVHICNAHSPKSLLSSGATQACFFILAMLEILVCMHLHIQIAIPGLICLVSQPCAEACFQPPQACFVQPVSQTEVFFSHPRLFVVCI